MSYKIYAAGQLRELTTPNSEAHLFRATTERFWINMVNKDHAEPLVAEIHDREADLYIITDGEGDLYLGGTLVNATTPQPGQHRGTDLTGASCHRLHAGDFIIIPEGTPHMLDTRQSSLVYLVVKINLGA